MSSFDKDPIAENHEAPLVEEISEQAEAPLTSTRAERSLEWQMVAASFLEDSLDAQKAEALGETLSEEIATADVDSQLADSAAAAEMLLDEAEEEETEILEFIEADQVLSIIESLLFSTEKPVSIATMKQVFKGTSVRGRDITRALDSLASDYAASTRGVAIEEINGGYQLRTKVDNAEYLRRLSKTRPFRLSGPALEVLAIIAYKQPMVKSEVDEIRGVESGHLVRALLERGLVCFNGKSELPGKPMQYGTTRKFLEIFGLRNLKELPTLSEIDQLIPEGIGDPDERKPLLSDITDSMSEFVKSTYSEGEDELLKITDQLAQIDSTSSFFEQEKIRQREKRDHDRAQDIREALAVGEAVDEKEQKWLVRYEAKLAQAAEALALAEQAQASGQAVAAEGSAGDSSLDAAMEAEAASEELADSDEESSDDLIAGMEWDEDSESAADESESEV
jgi:segregation and condensation protein B